MQSLGAFNLATGKCDDFTMRVARASSAGSETPQEKDVFEDSNRANGAYTRCVPFVDLKHLPVLFESEQRSSSLATTWMLNV